MNNTLTQVTSVPYRSDTTLDASLVRGIAWTSGMKWLSQLLSWACTIAVARLLTPADYGLVGMAVLYLELVTLINELGLGAAVITKQTLTDNQIAQLNSLSVLLGAAGFIISSAAAIPLSLFFHAPELRWVVPVMGVSCIVTAFRAVPSGLLQRELQFKTLAVIEGLQAVAAAVSVLLLALFGLRYWALVLGELLSRVVWTWMVLSRRTHSFAWPRFRSLQDALTFSSHVLVSRLSWYAQSNTDYFVAGRMFGKEVLGAYTLSFTVASIPTSRITAMVIRVAFPFFSAIQGDPAALRRYLLSLTKGLALLTFPLACGLALVADDFVLGVLGAKWQAAIAPLRCLAFLILLRAIVPLLTQILNVIGDSRYAMRVGIVSGVFLPLAFVTGSRWGILGVAAVWITVYPLVTIPLYWRVFQRLELSVAAYLKVLWPALSGSLLMAIAVWMIKAMLPHEWPVAARLSLQVIGGCAAYTVIVVMLHREHLQSFYRAIQLMRGRTAS